MNGTSGQPLELFHCAQMGPMGADISPRQCLVNQAVGKYKGEESMYWKCTECDLGKLYLEAAGGVLPEIRTSTYGTPQVVDSEFAVAPRHIQRRKNMAKNTKTAAAVIAPDNKPEPIISKGPETITYPLEPFLDKPQRPCKNHQDRESVPGDNKCRECLRAYQREWYQKKRAKNKQGETDLKPATAVVRELAQKQAPSPDPDHFPGVKECMEEAVVELCITCQKEPRSGNSKECKSCLTKRFSAPGVQEKRVQNCGERTRAAHQALKALETGKLCKPEDRYKPVFDLVEGLEEQIRERARQQLRSLEAEIAFLLREGLSNASQA